MTDTSTPRRNSSITTVLPALPKAPWTIAASIAAAACGRSSHTTTPLPAASPSAFTTTGKPSSEASTQERAAAASLNTSKRAVGMPCRRMNALANALLPSMIAAARLGPKQRIPSRAARSAMPDVSGASGPTTIRSIPSSAAARTMPCRSPGLISQHSAVAAMPALPGAQARRVMLGLRASAHTRACSRPPPPMTSTSMQILPSPLKARRRAGYGQRGCQPPRTRRVVRRYRA